MFFKLNEIDEINLIKACKKIANDIREIRLANNISDDDIRYNVDVSKYFVSRLEKGNCSFNVGDFYKYVKFIGLNVKEWLLEYINIFYKYFCKDINKLEFGGFSDCYLKNESLFNARYKQSCIDRNLGVNNMQVELVLFGLRIMKKRIELGYSRYQLQKKIFVRACDLWKIENGIIETAYKYAIVEKYYGFKKGELFFGIIDILDKYYESKINKKEKLIGFDDEELKEGLKDLGEIFKDNIIGKDKRNLNTIAVYLGVGLKAIENIITGEKISSVADLVMIEKNKCFDKYYFLEKYFDLFYKVKK